MKKKWLFLLRLDKWDSYFFKTPIARLSISGRRKYRSLNEQIEKLIEKAKAARVGYLVIKLEHPRLSYEKALLKFCMRKCGESIELVCTHPRLVDEGPLAGCTIRFFKRQDQKSVSQIAKDAFRRSYLYKCGFAARSQVDRYHSKWIENLSKKRGCRIFVAELGGKVIGFIALNTNLAKKKARIILIAIHKKYRGRGYGGLLIKACLGWAATRNKSIYVKTQKNNLRSLTLYRKMGFKEIKRDKIFFKNFENLTRFREK